jgi:hypothetical protein
MGDKPAAEHAPDNGAAESTEPEHHRGIAILLSLAAVLAALIAGRAAILSADAATFWQEGTRAQVKEAAAYVESIRYIYGVEVPRAMTVTETRFRVEELSGIPQPEAFSANTKRQIAIEKRTQNAVLTQVEQGSELATEYRTDSGFDPVAMLIDDREQIPELLEVHPHELIAEGDATGDKSILLIACSIIVALAFMCGSLARGFPEKRRLWLISGGVFLAVGLAASIVVEVA